MAGSSRSNDGARVSSSSAIRADPGSRRGTSATSPVSTLRSSSSSWILEVRAAPIVPPIRAATRRSDYVADLEELRIHLGLDRLLLLGHSHGGVVAQAYAARHPGRVERLVLASTLARFQEEQMLAMTSRIEAKAREDWYEDAKAALEAEQAGEWGTDEELAALVLREMPFYFASYGLAERTYIAGLEGEIPNGDALKLFNDEVFAAFDLRPEPPDRGADARDHRGGRIHHRSRLRRGVGCRDRRLASRIAGELRALRLRRAARAVRGCRPRLPARPRPRDLGFVAVGSRADDTRRLSSGKLPLELLSRLLDSLPPEPPEVRLGARVGEDACGIDVPAGVLVVAADPITLTSAAAGRLSVIVNANDVAVSGARPRWFLAVVLVPPGTAEAHVTELFDEIRRALDELGAHLVGGHTEITSAVTRPVVIGQMLGLAEAGAFLTTSGFRAGDVVLQIRPAPIEGAAVFARELGDQLGEIDGALLEAAGSALEHPGIGVVEAALLAARLGVNALHDPTEGGLAGGLHEMSEAGGVRIEVDREAVLWFEPGVAVCSALGADPWATLASGTLLGAFPPEGVDAALAAFAAEGHESAVIGTVTRGTGVFDTRGLEIPWPDRDEVARVLSRDETSSGQTAAGTI